MTTTHKLTGRRRFRSRTPVFGATTLILQVEVRCTGNVLDMHFCTPVDYIYWRDAQIEDLTIEDTLE